VHQPMFLKIGLTVTKYVGGLEFCMKERELAAR